MNYSISPFWWTVPLVASSLTLVAGSLHVVGSSLDQKMTALRWIVPLMNNLALLVDWPIMQLTFSLTLVSGSLWSAAVWIRLQLLHCPINELYPPFDGLTLWQPASPWCLGACGRQQSEPGQSSPHGRSRPGPGDHRRKFYTEEKAKVVAAAWGDRFYSIPCRASYFAPGRFEE